MVIWCRTPCSGRIYDALPSESRTARARLLRPKPGTALGSERACVLHLAGTGDFGHERRLNLGLPLVAQVRRIVGFGFKTPFPNPDSRVECKCVCELKFSRRAVVVPTFILMVVTCGT